MPNITLKSRDGHISRIETPEDFSLAYSPKQVNLRLREVKSTKDCIKADLNSIVLCRKKFGDDLISDTITAMVIKMCESINVNNSLTPDQIIDLSEIILSEFYFLSITELAYIFRCAKVGKYGTINSFALNQSDVLRWINTYMEDRISEFVKANEQRHEMIKSGKEVFIDADGKSKMRERTDFPEELVPVLSSIAELMTVKRTKEYNPNEGAEFIDTSNNEQHQAKLKRLREMFPDDFAE